MLHQKILLIYQLNLFTSQVLVSAADATTHEYSIKRYWLGTSCKTQKYFLPKATLHETANMGIKMEANK